MKRIDFRLYNNYEHWQNELCSYNENSVEFSLSLDDVLRAHYLLCDFFLREGEAIASPGPRDKTLLLSALDRQSVGFNMKLKWQDLYHVAATLFFGIVKNHPFHDGNKRTALLAALHQLQRNGRIASASKREFENLSVRTAAGRLSDYPAFRDLRSKGDAEIRTIAHFFRKNTRKVERNYVRVTYNQLTQILRGYNFEIRGPDANCIDIIKKIPTTKWYGGVTIKEQLIIQIGCPRMTAQINPKALKSVLKACGLTADDGYDSQVVFGDADPLDSLIGEFQDPLRRLKDR